MRELVADKKLRKHVFERIVGEWERTVDALLGDHRQERRLADNPLLARSIKNRFPYLDPLNHLQVELISATARRDQDVRVRRGIHLSINGIAAGLRNTSKVVHRRVPMPPESKPFFLTPRKIALHRYICVSPAANSDS